MLESAFTNHFTDGMAGTTNGEDVHKLRICAPGDISPKACKIIWFFGLSVCAFVCEARFVYIVWIELNTAMMECSDSGRQNERVKNWIHGNKNSLAALEQQLAHLVETGSSTVSLGGLYVHVRRRGADIQKKHDHHIFAYPKERKGLFCDAISQHLTNRPPGKKQHQYTLVDFSALALPHSLAAQFSMIGNIPNDARKSHYGMHGRINAPRNVCMDNHLLFQRPKHPGEGDSVPIAYPTSLRNRLLYFALNGSSEMVKGLTNYWAAGCPDSTDTGVLASTKTASENPTQKQKHYFSSATVDITAFADSQDDSIDINYRSVFYHYQHRLRDDGVIIWRVLHKNRGVFILNAVSMESKQIASNSYEHIAYSVVEKEVQVTRCSCSLFAHLYDVCQHQTQKDSLWSTEVNHRMCLHGRFLMTYLSDLCVNPNLLDTDHESALYQRIKQDKQFGDVVVLPEHDGRYALKMSVTGLHSNVLSFVHLCPDREKLSCMSGGCSHLLQNKKTSTILNKLDTTDQDQVKQMCPHLLQLRKHTDKWLHFCKPDNAAHTENNQDEATQPVDEDESTQMVNEEDEEGESTQQSEFVNIADKNLKLEDQKVVFDQNTGLWKHLKCVGTGKSLPENSPILTKLVNIETLNKYPLR